MVTVVLIFNVLIALLCLYVAWRVWQLRRALANIANALTVAERSTHNVLANAPNAIGQRQQGIYHLRRQYQQIEVYLQQVQKILSLLGLGQVVWQWYARNPSMGRSPVPLNSPTLPLEEPQSGRRSPNSVKRTKTKKPRATYT